MRIPESTIELILQQANIVDVVGQYVPLRVKGKNHWGNCPFHTEKTASFSVNEQKQIYYCFGCHAGGNVYKFLMEYKKISYVEAVVELAAELGIAIEYEDSSAKSDVSEFENLYELNEMVGRLYSEHLQNSAHGKTAMDYLLKRGLKLATIRGFSLGLAPELRNFLVETLSSNKEKLESAIELGLIGKTDQGKLYDRFAGRIIFPIFSTNGRIIAFAGRVMDSNSQYAKYVNSPESKIYSKSKVLYGLSHGKEEIRRLNQVIVVEGYMDLISLNQNGIKNVIAVSGTALTDEQAMLISRYTKEAVLLFDGDEAGIKASNRSIEILLKKSMNIRIASLPSGEDPDSFIRANSTDDFMFHINSAVNFLEFQTSFYNRNGALQDPLKSPDIIRELLKPVALIDDEIKRVRLLQSVAQKFNLRERLLEDELTKIMQKTAQFNQAVAHRKEVSEAREEERQEIVKPAAKKKMPGENDVVLLLLEGEHEIISFVHQHVPLALVGDDKNYQIVELFYTAFEAGEDVTARSIASKIHNIDLLEYYSKLATDKYTVSEEWEKNYPTDDRMVKLKRAALDIVRKLKLHEIDERIVQIMAQMKATTDREQIAKLFSDTQALYVEKKATDEKYRFNELDNKNNDFPV